MALTHAEHMRKYRQTHREQVQAHHKAVNVASRATAKNFRKRWLPAEIQMVVRHFFTDRELCHLLGRTRKAVAQARGKAKKGGYDAILGSDYRGSLGSTVSQHSAQHPDSERSASL